MWNRSAVCLLFFISLYQVIFSSSIYAPDIEQKLKELNSTKVDYRNVSDAAIKAIIDEAKSLIDSSCEKKRNEAIRLLEEKNDPVVNQDTDEESSNDEKINKRNRNARVGQRRVKRQGKFAQAAKVDNLKVLRIYLTMFKNLWAKSYVGGSHPFHPDVPKAVVELFKTRIMEYFFPPIGEDALKH